VDSYNFDNKSVNMIIILRWLSQGSRYCHSSRFDPLNMSPELLSRFEPAAREQLKQLVGNRVSQFFTIDSYSIEGRGPFVVKFLGERVTYVGRTETERKPYQFRVSIRNVESTHENPYGLLVTSVEQGKLPQASAP